MNYYTSNTTDATTTVVLEAENPRTMNQTRQTQNTTDSAIGIRQRAAIAPENTPPSFNYHASPAMVDEESESNTSGMGTTRAIILTVSLLGVLCFSVLATLFNARYQFFAFHGDMEEANRSCWQTATLFAVVATIAIFPSITNVLSARHRAKALQKKHVLPGAYRR